VLSVVFYSSRRPARLLPHRRRTTWSRVWRKMLHLNNTIPTRLGRSQIHVCAGWGWMLVVGASRFSFQLLKRATNWKDQEAFD